MRRATLAVLALALATTALAQQRDTPKPNGSIYGVALGPDGQPASRIGLSAAPVGGALAAVLPHTTTNDRGEYRFVNLPWWGRYTVFAEDEDAGYSSYSTGGFGQINPPEVEITPARREAELTVQLPLKAAFLRINLTNRNTGQPISGMQITVLHRSNPPSLVFSMSCAANKTVLLPPDQDLLVHITSKGFRQWDETVGGKALHLQSGTHFTLDVELEPSE